MNTYAWPSDRPLGLDKLIGARSATDGVRRRLRRTTSLGGSTVKHLQRAGFVSSCLESYAALPLRASYAVLVVLAAGVGPAYSQEQTGGGAGSESTEQPLATITVTGVRAAIET